MPTYSPPGFRPLDLNYSTTPDRFVEFNPVAQWPQDVIQRIRAASRVQPSFGTAGIPGATTPAAATAPGSLGTFAPLPGTATPATSFGAPTTGGPGGVNLLTNVKSPAIDQRLQDVLKIFDTTAQTTPQPFIEALGAARPRFTEFTNKDIGTLDYITSPGGLETAMANIRAARRPIARAAVDRSLADLGRILGLGRAGSTPGSAGSATGLSSSLERMGLNKAAELETQFALDDIIQQRADLENLTAQRMGALGKRGDLLRTQIGMELLPSQAQSQWFQGLAAALQPVIAGTGANTFYGLTGPGGYVGDTYGGLQQARLSDLARIEAARQADVNARLGELQLAQNYDLGLRKIATGQAWTPDEFAALARSRGYRAT